MNKTLGAHEVLDLHEILSDCINGLNTMQLYRPYAKDPQLQSMMNNHMQMMTMEYNNLVQTAHKLGGSEAMPVRGQKHLTQGGMQMNQGGMQMNQNFQPMYGLHQPQTQTPNASYDQVDDADVAQYMLSCHKHSASMKMKATLEMAHPVLRQMMMTGANRAADMAYECFQYANQKGYYQIPTLKDQTMNTFLDAYGTATQMGNQMPQQYM